jgi:hypothetical protein
MTRSHSLSRRTCLCCIAAIWPGASATANPRPICSFSMRDGWSDSSEWQYVDRKATSNDDSGIPQVVMRIMRSLSTNADLDIYIAKGEDNAFATVSNNRRVLVVDVGFLQKINRAARTEWAAIQIVAHEVGHHISGFSRNRHLGELNADYWSGQVCQRLGSAREAATAAILTVGTEIDTSTHPNKYRRVQSIESGWNDAKRGYIDRSHCLNGC